MFQFYNASLFHEINLLGQDVKFLWRFLDLNENEMEGVLIAKTNSYVAIGNFKYGQPLDLLGASCYRYHYCRLLDKSTSFIRISIVLR